MHHTRALSGYDIGRRENFIFLAVTSRTRRTNIATATVLELAFLKKDI
jgi:hypothetical protein